MRKTDNRITKQIEAFCQENGLTVETLAKEIKSLQIKKEYDHALKIMEDNRKLVDRCFKGQFSGDSSFLSGAGTLPFEKEMIFCKVVSERGESVEEVECIIFSQAPLISFRADAHLLWQPSDGITGRFFYNGIISCSGSKQVIRSLTEISEEEFESAAKDHLDQLLKTDWKTIAGPYKVRIFGDE